MFEAYRLIRAGGTRAKLLFLGDVLTTDKDTAALRTLRQLVAGAAFADDVRFLGFQQDVPLYLSLMDVVVEPSHHEGFPRIPVEAGAMGKPSVCTAVPGAEVAIEEGRTGLIVPIRDPRRLSEAVRKIIADPALAREMGERARRRVVELFDERAIVDQQLRIYQDFFSRKGARPARA